MVVTLRRYYRCFINYVFIGLPLGYRTYIAKSLVSVIIQNKSISKPSRNQVGAKLRVVKVIFVSKKAN